ncbi:hypothetical protein [Nisaea sp.]|uniref:hypothetical protein n=1 Tax=Nisaea sp. TaxID=2024842 RepID=UPI003267A56D
MQFKSIERQILEAILSTALNDRRSVKIVLQSGADIDVPSMDEALGELSEFIPCSMEIVIDGEEVVQFNPTNEWDAITDYSLSLEKMLKPIIAACSASETAHHRGWG